MNYVIPWGSNSVENFFVFDFPAERNCRTSVEVPIISKFEFIP
jgi:hypothetical protein